MIGQAINFMNLMAVVAVVAFGFLYSEFTVSTLKYVTTNSLNFVFAFLPYDQFASVENSILSSVRSMKSIAEISEKYDTQFLPSQFTFSIWAIIYFALSLFGILSLLTNKEEKERIGRHIGPLFFITNLLNISWMVAFSLEYLFISHLIIVGLWWSLFTLYSNIIDVRYGYSMSKYPLWVKLPFSIYLAWITVASVASTMMILKHDIMKPFIDSFSDSAEKEKLFVYNLDFTSPVLAVVSLIGVLTNMLNEQQWSATFITLTSIYGLWFSKFKRDSLFVLVLLWSLLGIMVKNWNTNNDGLRVVSQVNVVIMFFEFIFSLYHVLTNPGQRLTIEPVVDSPQKREVTSTGVLDIDIKGNQKLSTAAQHKKKK